MEKIENKHLLECSGGGPIISILSHILISVINLKIVFRKVVK